MNYKLVYTYRAGKDIQGLDRTIKNRIGKTLLRYKDDPFRHAERLIGSYRVKSENFSLRFQLRNSNIETQTISNIK